MDAEGREVKRLKFDKEAESEETSAQSGSSETCSAMVEETETTTSPIQDKEKETVCEKQHCKKEEEGEEEGMIFQYNYCCGEITLLNICAANVWLQLLKFPMHAHTQTLQISVVPVMVLMS